MPLGDSVTQGQSSSANYRSRLASLLQSNGIDSSFVGSQTTNAGSFPVGFTRHEGHSGWCSYDGPLPGVCQAGNASYDPSRPIGIDDNITTWFTNTPADIVLLLVGINDASSAQLQTSIGSIIDKILAIRPSCKILVGKIRTQGNAQSTKNSAITNGAAGKSNTTVVDPYAGWNESTMWADSLHPNTTGYNKMADNWYSFIRTAIQPNTLIDPTTPLNVQPRGFSSGYTLVMSDEFNSSTLDAKWDNEHDFADHSPSSAWDINAASNGALRMWWNGNVSTDNQQFSTTGSNPFRTRYGFFEARVKMPRGRGIFPGFWLYPYSNSQGENPDGQQQEIDIFEVFSYLNGDWLVDTVNYRAKNAVFTIWQEGGGGATTQTAQRFLRATHGYDSTLSTQYHTYGMRWTAQSGLQWYFDGSATGAVVPDPWGAGNNIQHIVLLQLWWGPNGGNPTPSAGATPTYSTTASVQDADVMLIDYVRAWTIGQSASFNAFLVSAPADGTTISGNVLFQIEGDLIANAELLPSTPGVYTPMYGRFTLTQGANNHVTGSLNWDTTALANGSISVRISAFSSPPGGSGSEIIVMTRTYIINNVAPTPGTPDPDMEFFCVMKAPPAPWQNPRG